MNILIAGAGGVLGRHLVDEFYRRGMKVAALGYDKCEFSDMGHKLDKAICCDVTKPQQLKGLCEGMDIVISCIGITRMKNKLTHMDVDYRGNLSLLGEAKKSQVKKFVFISPAGVDDGCNYVPLFKAKFLFEEELKKSGINWLIFRSGGFFSDLAQMSKMAQKGMMYVIGKGSHKFTPIDTRELAEIMAEDSLKIENRIVEVGGPQDLTWHQICKQCLDVFDKKPVIISVPVWLCRTMLSFIKPFSLKYFAMGRLILFTSTVDLTTTKRGKTKFVDYLNGYYKRAEKHN